MKHKTTRNTKNPKQHGQEQKKKERKKKKDKMVEKEKRRRIKVKEKRRNYPKMYSSLLIARIKGLMSSTKAKAANGFTDSSSA